MITVMGATGHTGREVTRLLCDAGEPVRALGRSAERLEPLTRWGATSLVGEAGDPGYLTEAFAGADAVYTLVPHDPRSVDYHREQERMGEAIVDAVRAAGVRHVVALSSVGADRPAGGFIAGLHAQEERLRSVSRAGGVHVLFLRPGSFFENFAESAAAIRRFGVHADAVDPDAPVPMIATGDVAAVAAEALRARDWTGTVVRELLGPRDLTHAEATAVLGARMGLPDLSYVRLPDDELVAVLQDAGFSPVAAALHIELGRALSDGTVVSRQGRTPATTTPTRFEDFVAAAAWAAP